MMTSPVFVLYLTCLFMGKMAQLTDLKSSSSVHQGSGFISANVGDSVTLKCSVKGDDAGKLYWYKQPPREKPRLISFFYEFDRNYTFYDEFKNNPRFTLDTGNSKNHLTFTDLQISDSATYYCVSSHFKIFKFLEVTTLNVKVDSLVLVYFLSGALAFTTILSVLLAFSMYKMKRNSHSKVPGSINCWCYHIDQKKDMTKSGETFTSAGCPNLDSAHMYTHHDTVSQMEEVIVMTITSTVDDRISNSRYVRVIVDETTNITVEIMLISYLKHEQRGESEAVFIGNHSKIRLPWENLDFNTDLDSPLNASCYLGADSTLKSMGWMVYIVSVTTMGHRGVQLCH
ncbi:uncharacterized protein LOC128383430 [Scomber japonicus]|uniref:uncharacterized protein LOC128383430 n=1 Tax=Scomber japonicus TaxID=13676 RepID=UPI002305717E|nr:uncharacterized protein LOC128383430 [Scomber japonicus]